MNEDPMVRAKRLSRQISELQHHAKRLDQMRRDVIAEMLCYPGVSLATVARELGLSKSYIGKLAPSAARQAAFERLVNR